MESIIPTSSGRSKVFETLEERWCWEKDGNMYNNVESFAVFTGVEVERGRRGALRMIKHKSKRYSFGQWWMDDRAALICHDREFLELYAG
ncbi:hypothetical protein U9M48_021641 [Paspalum notatum var. saurae]|uniref:Uncharacterized protein n=1 Tax=Paspalum notatum var. saurae TaxID=547442 RepID=A0AAQ3TH68_PASNO